MNGAKYLNFHFFSVWRIILLLCGLNKVLLLSESLLRGVSEFKLRQGETVWKVKFKATIGWGQLLVLEAAACILPRI